MKLKSYMRGLGIGIVVTALIMGMATKDGRPLTDAEIKAAAVKLGMVESSSLKLTDLNQGGTEPQDRTESQSGVESEDGTEPQGGTEEPEDGTEPQGGTEEPEDGTEPQGGTEEPEDETEPQGGTEEPEDETEPQEEAEPGDGEPAPGPAVTQGTTQGSTAASNPDTTPASEESPAVDTVKITVTSGTGSRTVCNQLADAGLIEDAAAFDQYLIDSGYSKRISAGTFEIPKGASEEEIAKIISKSR